MKDQINTIREALVLGIKAINHLGGAREAMPLHDAMPALAQIEAAVGEPVAWAVYWGLPPTRQNSVHFDKESAQAVANQIKSATEVRPLYAAPVAQQRKTVTNDEQASAYMDARLWEFIDMAGMWPRAKPDPRIWAHVMVYAPVAQQPQARPDFADEWTGYLKDGETPFERFLRERKDVQSVLKLYQRALEENERLKAQQPQAEAVPSDHAKWCAYVAGMIGCYLGEADDSAKVKAIAGIIERRIWASAHQPLKIAAWRGVHVEGDYLYYDEFPEELTDEQRRQLHLKPLYELPEPPQQAEAGPNEQQIEAVCGAVAVALGGAYDCSRHWSAWSYGTMGPDDFSQVSEDDDRVREIALAALGAVGLKVTP